MGELLKFLGQRLRLCSDWEKILTSIYEFSWELGLDLNPVLKYPKGAQDGLSPYPPSAGANKSLCSDTESLGGSCESRSLDSPNSSPGESHRNSCLILPKSLKRE